VRLVSTVAALPNLSSRSRDALRSRDVSRSRNAAAAATLVAFISFATAALGQPTVPAPAPSTSASPAPVPAPLQLAKTHLQLNPKATTEVAISGGLPPYTVVLSAPVAEATIDAARATLSLRALATGSATLSVSDAAGATVVASVLVAPNAGFVPSDVSVALLGAPGPDFIAAQIRAALQRASRPLPGARIVLAATPYPENLRPGERLDVAVRVHLDGANRYVDVDGIANVHVIANAAPRIEPATLFYSDDPEKVSADGVLFSGTLSLGRSIRLYYYHQAAVTGRELAILLDSPAGTAQVRVVGQGAGPNAAVMFVGQSATFRYLDGRARGAGVTLDVPVGAPVELFAGDGPVQAADLVAGVLDVAVADGDPVRVTVVSVSEGSDLRALLGTGEVPSDGRHRRGEYDLSKADPLALAYRVGEAEPPPVSVGGVGGALPNLRPGGHGLAGDYGLLRPLDFTLANPTDAAASVYFYEQPIGYPVTTTTYFDGDPAPLRVQCVKTAGKRYLVRAFGVAPRTTERITGSYMTDGGSTYPLTFGLSPAAPAAPPATMTAADGCFPKSAVPAPAPPAPRLP